MLTIENTIEIKSSVEQVWEVLTDRDNYAQWNPVILSQTGVLKRGCRAKMRINPALFSMNVDIVYRQVQTNKELSWFGGPPLIKGYHYFKLQSLPNGNTQVIHGERFGFLATLMGWPAIVSLVKMKYKKADRALKKRCETLFNSQQQAA